MGETKEIFLIGLAFVGFGLWDIYEGSSSFFLIGRWWMWPRFERGEQPWCFWFCVSLNFAIALFCFVTGLRLLAFKPQ